MKIEGIKKVALTMEGGESPEELTLWPKPLSLEFIYGIGTSGLTPFELLLSNKEAGDVMSLRMKRDEAAGYFMHLWHTLSGIPEDIGDVYFRLKITDVSDAGQNEVIKAMAEMTACGDSCCGGH